MRGRAAAQHESVRAWLPAKAAGAWEGRWVEGGCYLSVSAIGMGSTRGLLHVSIGRVGVSAVSLRTEHRERERERDEGEGSAAREREGMVACKGSWCMGGEVGGGQMLPERQRHWHGQHERAPPRLHRPRWRQRRQPATFRTPRCGDACCAGHGLPRPPPHCRCASCRLWCTPARDACASDGYANGF
jgi:hypothetical protein